VTDWEHSAGIRREELSSSPAIAKTNTPTFLVPHTWPDIRNAEYEVLKRLSIAAENIGSTMIAVDNDGRPLWSSRKMYLDRSKRVAQGAANFMLSLHFESPRLFDIYSYYAAWQPLQFYHQFGYNASVEKVLTHSDWISCDSKLADAHARNLFSGCRPGISVDPPQLFHSPPQPYLPPKISNKSRPFYVGINWERINGQKGRHHDLLVRLDGADLVDIYGPKKFLGTEPWKGFKSYRGELPFDGRSVVRAQHESGICLALSSEAHRASGLMSNRLFEGLAAGAVIIADSNRFVEEHFSDVVYFVDEEAGQEDLFFQIKTIVEEIRSDPDRAIARALKGQERLAERFSLEKCLEKLIAGHPERVERFKAAATSSGSVTVVIVYAGASLETLMGMLETVTRQVGVKVEVALVCDKMLLSAHEMMISDMLAKARCGFTGYPSELARFEPADEGHRSRPVLTGPSVASALADIKTDYFSFLRSDEIWFQDHLTTLIASVERHPSSTMGASGALAEVETSSSPARRHVASMTFDVNEETILSGKYDAEPGRFVLKRQVLENAPLACLSVLDGQEHNLLRIAAMLSGSIAHSGLATFVHREAEARMLPRSILDRDHQQQYIRDAFASSPQWRARMSALESVRDVSSRSAFTAPTRWGSYSHPRNIALKLPLGVAMPTTQNGAGEKYLAEGFSSPESQFTWIEGESGIIEFACAPEDTAASLEEELVLEMIGRPSRETGRQQHCTILINGLSVAYVFVPDVKTEIKIRIPRLQNVSKNGWVRIEIIPDHSELVYDKSGKVVDARRLSIALSSFELRSFWLSTPPAVTSGRVYPTNAMGAGIVVFAAGFSHPEPTGTWMIGKAARLQFKVVDYTEPMALVLRLRALKSDDGADQSAIVWVNGREAATFAIPAEPTDCGIPLTREMAGEDGVCRVALSFLHAGEVRNPSGKVTDARPLAAHLIQFTVARGSSVSKANRQPLRKVAGKVRRALQS